MRSFYPKVLYQWTYGDQRSWPLYGCQAMGIPLTTSTGRTSSGAASKESATSSSQLPRIQLINYDDRLTGVIINTGDCVTFIPKSRSCSSDTLSSSSSTHVVYPSISGSLFRRARRESSNHHHHLSQSKKSLTCLSSSSSSSLSSSSLSHIVNSSTSTSSSTMTSSSMTTAINQQSPRFEFVEAHFDWNQNVMKAAASPSPIPTALEVSHKTVLQIHLVHYNTMYGSCEEAGKFKDGIVVLTVSFHEDTQENLLLNSLIDGLTRVTKVDSNCLLEDLSLRSLIPGTPDSFSTMRGTMCSNTSLEEPSCQQCLWISLTHSQTIGYSQLRELQLIRMRERKQGGREEEQQFLEVPQKELTTPSKTVANKPLFIIGSDAIPSHSSTSKSTNGKITNNNESIVTNGSIRDTLNESQIQGKSLTSISWSS